MNPEQRALLNTLEPTEQREQLNEVELQPEELPELEAPDIDEFQAGPNGWKGFVQKRQAQLVGFKQKVNDVAQKVFSQDIDGVHFTAKEMLAARFHPSQLKANFTGNVNAVRGKRPDASSRAATLFQEGPHAILDNVVLREAAYRKAIDGDEHVNDYLQTYDRRYGETDVIQRNEWKELIAGMTGYALVRKIGLYGVATVTIAQSYKARGDALRIDQLDQRVNRLNAVERIPAGMKKAYKHKAAMDELRERKRQQHARDPFDF